MKRTHALLAAVLLAMTLMMAGCGSDSGGDDVASASGDSTKDSDKADVDPQEAMVKYTQCLRKHGLDIEDPEPGKGIQLKVEKGQAETAEKAMAACKDLQPQMNEEDRKAATENALKFAQCMRKNGVEDFADPDPSNGGIRVDRDVAEDPDFKEAQERCGDLMGGPGSMKGDKS
jgi:predicted small secreted protein